MVYVATVGPKACVARSEVCRSATQRRGEVAYPPPVRKVTGPPRCETEQAKGRRPYLATGTAVSLHAHKSRGKDAGGVRTSADTFQGVMPKKTLLGVSPEAQTITGPPVMGDRPP